MRQNPRSHSCALLVVLLLAGAMSRASAQSSSAPFTVFLDAAHGGPDIGTTLSPQLLEKDLVLTLSVRLRSALTARGMRVLTTREADTDPSPEMRAAQANHAHPAACLVLHATASGSGVHLYTSSLSQVPASPSLTPWSTANASFETQSLKLASDISTALSADSLPYTIGRIRLEPMDSMECPAVAVEVAPLRTFRPGSGHASAKLSQSAYQKRLVDDLAAALVEWRGQVPAPGGRR